MVAACVAVYFLVGGWLGWRQAVKVFALCRRSGGPVREARVAASQELGIYLLFWPVVSVSRFVRDCYDALLDKAEKASWTRAEQIARLEKQVLED